MKKLIPTIVLLVCFLYSCESYNLERSNQRDTLSKNYKPELPTLTTSIISEITDHSGTSGGTITSDGFASITDRGICWSTAINPTVDLNTKTTESPGSGTFVSKISGLSLNTIYYVRSYASNIAGTAYGNQLNFKTSISDIDGNFYSTVTIGNQEWMKENLKTTKYQDGSSLTTVNGSGSSFYGLYTGAYCWYNKDIINKNVYGALYNWYAVNTGKLCPVGWHVPTDNEWGQLESFLGGYLIAGGKLKETGITHWQSPNTGATDAVGFSALPGGYYYMVFGNKGNEANFWTSTPDFGVPDYAIYRGIVVNSSESLTHTFPKFFGHSVRCLKNQ